MGSAAFGGEISCLRVLFEEVLVDPERFQIHHDEWKNQEYWKEYGMIICISTCI